MATMDPDIPARKVSPGRPFPRERELTAFGVETLDRMGHLLITSSEQIFKMGRKHVLRPRVITTESLLAIFEQKFKSFAIVKSNILCIYKRISNPDYHETLRQG